MITKLALSLDRKTRDENPDNANVWTGVGWAAAKAFLGVAVWRVAFPSVLIVPPFVEAVHAALSRLENPHHRFMNPAVRQNDLVIANRARLSMEIG
ncbi:MAG: hypothetical protein JXO72_11265 [Vicinamibacteria bacterium]|nr:hypothetical protein [Vicinamibacteria bacterium]